MMVMMAVTVDGVVLDVNVAVAVVVAAVAGSSCCTPYSFCRCYSIHHY